jgi:nucleoside-diphosphate-sugar epimerase
MTNKTILITGASGLIGQHLVATANKYLKVYGIDHKHDLTDLAYVNSLPKVDYNIHGAGYAEPARFMADPIRTIKLNTTTLLCLFEHLKPNGKLLFLSSSEIYSGAKPPYKETDIGITNPNHPRACYIESKRCGEVICNVYKAKIARLSLVYGPGVNDNRALNDFIKQGLKGHITLKDEGNAKRTYCYVSDAVELLWRILYEGEGTYNVGGISKVTIKELAETIASMLQVSVTFGNQGLKEAPSEVDMDLSRIRKEFNKTEYVSLDIGLKDTINWFKQYGGVNVR